MAQWVLKVLLVLMAQWVLKVLLVLVAPQLSTLSVSNAHV
jgi:hypothetical protein